MIRGGQDKVLRERRILKVLDVIGELGLLPLVIVSKLKESYQFLRLVENRLQQYEDKQTHDIPNNEKQRFILAYGLGYNEWQPFNVKIAAVRKFVHEVFNHVIESPHSYPEENLTIDWIDADASLLSSQLINIGYSNPELLIKLIIEFQQSYAIRQISTRGTLELNRLFPLILQTLIKLDNSSETLGRLFILFKAIAGRNVYFTLLIENPLALSQLIKLSSMSSWIVKFISACPLLLDELLDHRTLYAPLSRQSLNEELDYYLSQIDIDDMDALLNALRHFKNANMLRIASADLSGIISINVVSDYLTWLAETILHCVLQHAWRLTSVRYGTPPETPAGKIKGFGVIAYGKLGGLELSYASDLDLVFLYGGVNDTTLTISDNPIPCVQFYAMVVKRMVMLLTTQVLSGTLYEIDLRLRPSGNSGLLVSSLEAYETYQMESSWTWEQQALVRARFVTGDSMIAEHFNVIRQRSLCRKREESLLRREVMEMRSKMRENLEIKSLGRFDLKQAVGCIADIEFIVQFGVLAMSHEHHNLTLWTDVLRLLASLHETGFLSQEEADLLKNAYCLFREQSHRAALLEQTATASEDEFVAIRSRVRAVWRDKIERI